MSDEPIVVDCAILDAQKENIAPTRQGHSAAALQNILSVPRAQRAQQLQETKAQFTRELQEAHQSSHDPLDAYVRFIKWTVDNYPAGKSADSGLVPLLELATRAFKEDPAYKSDFRYLNIWFQYASLVSKPQLIYAYLLANDIGIWYAQTYEEYANVLERDGNRSRADEVYRLGIARKAKPLGLLQTRYNEFMTRMLSAPPTTSQSNNEPIPDATNSQPTLGGRKVLGVRTGTSSSSAAPSSSGPAPRTGNRGKIAVFVDGPPMQGELQSNEWRELDSQVAANKENSQEATPWKGQRLPQLGAATPKTPKISVFRDEDSELPTTTPGKTAETLAIRAEKPPTEAELLFQDPLRNFVDEGGLQQDIDLGAAIAAASSTQAMPPPTRLPSTSSHSRPRPPSDQQAGSAPTSTSSHSRMPKPRPFIAPEAIPGKKPEKWQFNLNLLWNEADQKEYCIAEARARSLGLYGKVWPAPPPPTASGSGVRFEALKGDGSNRTMMREPTVTINTKAAMNDVFDMFNGAGDEEDSFEDEGASLGGGGNMVGEHPGGGLRSSLAFASSSQMQSNIPTATPRIKPFVDPASASHGASNSKATPRFTPFVDLEGSGENGSSSSMSTHAQGSSKTPLAMRSSAAPLNPSSSVLRDSRSLTTAAPTPATSRRPLAFKPFVDGEGDDHMGQVPPTPTPASGHTIPSQLFSAKSPNLLGESAVTPVASSRAKSFDIFRDVASSETARATSGFGCSTTTTPPGAPPVTNKMDAVFSSVFGSDRENEASSGVAKKYSISPKTFPAIKFVPSPDNTEELDPPRQQNMSKITVFMDPPNPPNDRMDLDPHTDSDESEDDYRRVEPDPMHQNDQADEEDYDEELQDDFHSDRPTYRPLSRFPPINEMTPITERTLEYTRMSVDSRRPSLAAGYDEVDEAMESNTKSSQVRRKSRASLAPRRDQSLMPDEEIDEDEVQIPNPCNPFSPMILAALLDLVPVPFDDFRDTRCGRLDMLQKFGAKKPKLNKSSSGGNNIFQLTLGDFTFDVTEKIGEGGFGAVFRATLPSPEDTGDEESQLEEDLAIKVVRPAQLWEFTIICRIREAIFPALRESIIQPRALYVYEDESYLILDHRQHGTLLDCVNKASGTDLASSGDGLAEILAMFFTIELFKIVEGLHVNGFIHGDLKIDNCLVRLAHVPGGPNAWSLRYDPTGENGWSMQGIQLIDFGRAIDTTLFPEGQTFEGDWPTDARDCIEMREGKPWTFEADYHGLAGIIYCMLFKKYIEIVPVVPSSEKHKRYKVAAQFKRYWNGDLWGRIFDLLLNPKKVRSDGTLPIPDEMAKLRHEMEQWLVENSTKGSKNLRGMLKKIWNLYS
ncbi:hypothetical protein FRC03_006748 [Tulasnella sp. 419]|nr:hypothetical protein FRC03_006748 [Tulasnella sp. 419]